MPTSVATARLKLYVHNIYIYQNRKRKDKITTYLVKSARKTLEQNKERKWVSEKNYYGFRFVWLLYIYGVFEPSWTPGTPIVIKKKEEEEAQNDAILYFLVYIRSNSRSALIVLLGEMVGLVRWAVEEGRKGEGIWTSDERSKQAHSAASYKLVCWAWCLCFAYVW